LREGFNNPPSSAKAQTFWKWLNGNITKEGITADLEAMKRVGIQEALIFNADMAYPDGPAPYLSDNWLELFKFAASEADRLGLNLGFNNAAGWSASGGPWVIPENSMQTVVFSETRHTGGVLIEERLQQPPTRLNYYKDISVLAFPSPRDNSKIKNLAEKSLAGGAIPDKLQPEITDIPQAAIIRKSDVIDLTANVSADGIIRWKVPEGEWTIIRFGFTTTGAENRPAEKAGRGLECDKLSRAAVDAFWEGGIEPVIKKLGPLIGKSLTNCVIDSYEVGCGNWTPGFETEFAKRKGYDCLDYLPVLAGYYLESSEISERFLWDFRRVIGDMMAENYYGYFAALCHKQGMRFFSEPYGGPFDCLQVGDMADVPMNEFWVGTSGTHPIPKMVSSVSHLNGNPISGAEAFTADGRNSRWLNQPSTMKTLGDRTWTEGTNRFIFHTYAHQPWNKAPGVTFNEYGTEISRLNTWWEPGAAYMNYLAKSQFMLQQGRCVADVLVFVGEESPNEGMYCPDIKALGYDYDEIGISKIGSVIAENGIIKTPAGGEYRLLVLPDCKWMTPALVKKISELVKGGAKIIGPKPDKSPSLQGYPACDNEVARIADQAWSEVIQNRSIKDVLNDMGLAPDFSGGKTGKDLLFIHRMVDDRDIYFVSNQKQQNRIETCSFRVTGKQPEIWNAETGKIETVAQWQSDGKTTTLPLFFKPDDAFFIVFKKADQQSVDQIVQVRQETAPVKVQGLRGLKIIKARYGSFLPEGLTDVTEALRKRVKEEHVTARATSGDAGTDPAPGIVKELQVEYTVGGQTHKVSIPEWGALRIPLEEEETGDNAEFKIVRAIYGKFTTNFDGLYPAPPEDITAKVSSMIDEKKWIFPVDDRLTGKSVPNNSEGKELRLEYTVEGEMYNIKIPAGDEVNLQQYVPGSRLAVEAGKLIWITPYTGKITATSISGKTKTAQVKAIPKPVEISGAWEVTFPPDRGAPAKATFDKLYSWTESADEGIQYFSGTATYRKQVFISRKYIQEGRSLELDLGSVRSLAEVIVNGKNLGVLWKVPFAVDLGKAVKAGQNDIQIRITNLWPNRLIGDERYPDDFDRSKGWPDWLINNTERHSERITFTTWKHWNKDDKLLPSGLLGPVILRTYQHMEMD
jgi:hypothetical protein